jgi:hypothetical protein
LKKTHHKIGLSEWLKKQALSSNPSTTQKKIALGEKVAKWAGQERLGCYL